jgi:hypothetical protein
LTRIKRAAQHRERMIAVLLHHRAVPWNESYYPPSMKRLPPAVRAKAIEIANALLEAGREEGSAIRIAIAKAKEWAAHQGALAPRAKPRRSRS